MTFSGGRVDFLLWSITGIPNLFLRLTSNNFILLLRYIWHFKVQKTTYIVQVFIFFAYHLQTILLPLAVRLPKVENHCVKCSQGKIEPLKNYMHRLHKRFQALHQKLKHNQNHFGIDSKMLETTLRGIGKSTNLNREHFFVYICAHLKFGQE